MLTIKEICEITRGQLLSSQTSLTVKGVSIDSRTLKRGDLYIAIEGQRLDGHAFIKGAIKKGAAAVIISKKKFSDNNVPTIFVRNTTEALGQCASLYRQKFNIPIIAITGSAGKTTTKDMIAAVLQTQLRVLKNDKTENNQYGVPLTLLKLKSSHQAAVIELGTNQPGDIRGLTNICKPTHAVYTNIAEVHLKGLKNKAGVWREKSYLIRNLDKKGRVILNRDDHYLNKIRSPHSLSLISYSINQRSDFQAKKITTFSNGWIGFTVKGYHFRLKSPTVHNVYNALAAICCGSLFRISYNNISTSIQKFRLTNARQEIFKVGRFVILNDTYNANPLSFKSAVETLSQLPVKGKRIVVCADMLELGGRSASLHKKLGRYMADSDIDFVVSMGKEARFVTEAFKNHKNLTQAVHCDTRGGVHERLKRICQPGDAILIKGSRSMRMEKTVAYLVKHLN